MKAGLPTAIFSLEMSRNEIMMRLILAEATVPLHSMRTGMMSEENWARLARRMSEVADAPLFIDDWPHMSVARHLCVPIDQNSEPGGGQGDDRDGSVPGEDRNRRLHRGDRGERAQADGGPALGP